MTESDQILLLQKWDAFLAAQGTYFDACIVKLIGHPHVADEESVAFLQVDDKLAKPAVEKAAAAFIRDGTWPTLDYRECLHLILRAHVARATILAVLGGTPQAMAIKAALPDLENRGAAIRWFLVDLWNVAGKPFLAGMADDFLKTRGQIVDRPPDHR